MKQIKLLSILFIALFVGSCSSSKTPTSKKPEGIGKMVYQFLQEVTTKEMSELREFYIDSKELAEFVTQNFEEGSKSKLTDLVKNEEWEEYVGDRLNELRKNAASLGIEWEEAIYLDYIYKYSEKDKLYHGELFFKSNSDVFAVMIHSIEQGGKYKVFGIEKVKKLNRV